MSKNDIPILKKIVNGISDNSADGPQVNYEGLISAATYVGGGFDWASTKEGGPFWNYVHDRLHAMARKAEIKPVKDE